MNVMVAAHVICSWARDYCKLVRTTRRDSKQGLPDQPFSSQLQPILQHNMRLWRSLFCILRISARHETTSGDTQGARGHHHCGSLTRPVCHVCNLVHIVQWTRKINFPNTGIISGLVSVVMTVSSAQALILIARRIFLNIIRLQEVEADYVIAT